MSVVEALKQAVSSHPNTRAVVCGSNNLKFAELSDRVNRLSSALANLGIRRGDRVAVLSLNCHRFLEMYYGVPQLGAAIVPINYRLPAHEVQYILEHSGSRAIAVDDTMRPLIEGIRPRLSQVEHFISIGDTTVDGFVPYETLLESGSPSFEGPQIDPSELMGLFYTSGTTGEPKGVMLTHANVESNVRHSMSVYQYRADDIYLHAAPMFHLADGAAVFVHTARAGTQVLIPRFDPTLVLEAVQRERVTLVLLVPTMINFMLHHPELNRYDLSSIRHITYGASPIAPEVLKRAMETFGCEFGQGYGLTEASPLLTVLTAEDHRWALQNDERVLASCGKPVPGVEVRVVDFEGNEVKPGDVGEIIARGPNIMAGYWKRSADTADAIRDGWLHTGDLATVDRHGYLYLVDRKKDMIVTGGENVFSTEVEAVLYQHPAIKEAAVIPIPDPDWGESVHACITLKEGVHLTQQEVIEFCRPRLANYKLPRSVEFVDGELPKGGTGKILKKQLRERYWSGRERRVG